MQNISKWILKFIALWPALFVLGSVLALLAFGGEINADLWGHIAEHLLFEAVLNTLYLLVGVAVVSSVLGVGLAWLASFVSFPGQRFFSVAFALPLAFPAYVLAFIWIGSLDFAGPVQSFFRESLNLNLPFPPIRSRGGIIAVLSIALYPYVFLLAREGFRSQGRQLYEAAQSLGCRPRRAIYRLSLPLAMPWILSGLALVAMESVADFGVASAFNYNTLTILIYKTWNALFSLNTASQISLLHLLFVSGLFFVLWNRKTSRSYAERSAGQNLPQKIEIAHPWLLTLGLGVLWALLFVFPTLQLLVWSWEASWDERMLEWILNTVGIAVAVSLAVCILSLLMGSLKRFFPEDKLLLWGSKIALLGYAFPGTVLAVALTVGFILIFGGPLSQITSLALAAMMLALTVRFMAVGAGTIENAFRKIPHHLDEASQNLQASGLRLFGRVHLPLVKSSLYAGAFFVFMDCVKEMPIQVMMRPYSWDTLSVKVYEFTSEGEWQRAALPALFIVLVSLIPPALLVIEKKRKIGVNLP